jgi:hypothetical protein
MQPTERLQIHYDRKFEKTNNIKKTLEILQKQSPFKQLSSEKYFNDSPNPSKN